MQEKGNPSQPIGICHRLITFIMNSHIARSLVKRVTLGHPIPQDLQPMIPAADPNGAGQTMCLQALQTPENESVFEIQIHYKQTDEDFEESWTQVDKLGPIERTKEAEIQDKGPQEVNSKLISTATSQPKEPKKSSSIEDVGELEKEKNKKKKGKGVISGEKLTLAMEVEDEISRIGLRRVRPLFYVAPNINEKSDAFIRSRKEAMRRNYGLEPRIS
ncbi:PREDICTED: CICLE_v10024153mg [Prunus dulcis]|uniref:PREDICTED: CICLE_v10024153mg n=1 Tax=Prunus dulcis TaxID=3755 RepID=A0A5E4EEA9_PRUDU|nr:PREDICTED: CICLE_v10024153mg [Prunus dulcis]